MKLHIEIRPVADRDIIDLADFIAVDNLQAATRFLEQLEATFARLATNPRLGRPAGFPDAELRDLRVCLRQPLSPLPHPVPRACSIHRSCACHAWSEGFQIAAWSW